MVVSFDCLYCFYFVCLSTSLLLCLYFLQPDSLTTTASDSVSWQTAILFSLFSVSFFVLFDTCTVISTITVR